MRATIHRHNTTKTSRILDAVHASLRFGWATVPMIAAYVVVVTTTFLWYEPAPVTKYYRTVSKLDVYPGEEVVVNATVQRSKGGCDSIVTRTWTAEDGRLIVRTQHPVEGLPSGLESYSRPAVIPPLAPMGNLWLQTEVEFFCNPVQRLLGGTHFPMPDILFNVRPKSTATNRAVGIVVQEAFAGSYP